MRSPPLDQRDAGRPMGRELSELPRTRKQNLAKSRRCYALAIANLNDRAEYHFWLARVNTWGEKARH